MSNSFQPNAAHANVLQHCICLLFVADHTVTTPSTSTTATPTSTTTGYCCCWLMGVSADRLIGHRESSLLVPKLVVSLCSGQPVCRHKAGMLTCMVSSLCPVFSLTATLSSFRYNSRPFSPIMQVGSQDISEVMCPCTAE